MLNFLSRMGFSLSDEREKFTFDDLVAELDLGRITTGGPVFDLAKLDWLNGLYLRDLSPEALVARLQAWLLGTDYLRRVAPLVQERISRLEDFVTSTPLLLRRRLPAGG
jgi:glutamyl-tRNA synthetase